MDQLLGLIAKDDANSFRVFYDLYYRQVFRYACYFVNDAGLAREVVSNVFFSVWQSRRRLPAVSDIDAYLYISTKNEAGRYLRSRKEQAFTPLDDWMDEICDDEGNAPDQQLIHRELTHSLMQIVNGLPEKCREIFLLSRMENKKPKEIAALLKITESTVRVQMKIAIEKIMQQIHRRFPDI